MNKVSVIIPAVNEESHIEGCIRSVWEAGGSEIIVSDGGSSDQTVPIARALGATVVAGTRGRAMQQNRGALQAQGDILLFLHADNKLGPESCRQIHTAVRDPRTVCGAFQQRIQASGLRFRLLEQGNAARIRYRGLAYGDQAIFVRHDTFRQLGGFPEVRLLEDLLLMKRLRKIAWPALLPGPVYVSPRRWQRHGVVRQTVRNWLLLGALQMGVSPDRLADFYARHDSGPAST